MPLSKKTRKRKRSNSDATQHDSKKIKGNSSENNFPGNSTDATLIGNIRAAIAKVRAIFSGEDRLRINLVASNTIQPSSSTGQGYSNPETPNYLKALCVLKKNGEITCPTGSVEATEEGFNEPGLDERNDRLRASHPLFQPPTNVSINPSSYQYTGQVENIDEHDNDDPLCATEYVQNMYTLFREREPATSVCPIYMENQAHINERMRSILVDWLVEVHFKFKLVPETLYLTVNLIDRYLETEEVSPPKLQLVGITSLLIASKYEEIYPPKLDDLVYICDHAYTRNDIIGMEETILKMLEYQITIPSAHAFLVRYLKAAHANKKIVQLSCYILDGTLQSYNLLHYLPSQLAAAAVFIARRSIGRNSWSPTLLKYAGYCKEEVIPVARAILAEKSSTSPELQSVNKKYTHSCYGSVASTVLQCDFYYKSKAISLQDVTTTV